MVLDVALFVLVQIRVGINIGPEFSERTEMVDLSLRLWRNRWHNLWVHDCKGSLGEEN